MKTESRDPKPRTIDPAKLRQNIVQRTATPIAWIAGRLLVDSSANSEISELYADYKEFCLRGRLPALQRKTWLQVVKLTGLSTASGGLLGVKLKTGPEQPARESASEFREQYA